MRPFVHAAVLGLGLIACHPAAAEELHHPRHGGIFGDADDLFHYELVLQPGNRLLFYVSDDENHPQDTRTLQGRWTVNPDSRTPITGAFTPNPDGAFFLGQLPASLSRPIQIQVEVLKGTQWVAMEFSL